MTFRNLSDPSEERASRAMTDIVETRDPRERFGRAGLYPADLDPTEDSSGGRLLPGARRGRERQLSRIVALGGGSGLPVVLRGLRRHLPPSAGSRRWSRRQTMAGAPESCGSSTESFRRGTSGIVSSR